ncbi:MAG: hypothetical protein CMK49_00150 [Prochlorococcus sp. SP3034]|nr:hypothetical protein [Prochlorococcus sp. SP3034]|tara:strand:- start:3428 stop:3673 length:246 start_codon:yes stop_codon:yes gene_type:complete
MGEAKRRKNLGLPSKKNKDNSNIDNSPKIVEWLPFTTNQKNNFIKLTIKGGWIGIALLVILWVVVRFIGPTLGWWTPADSI